MREIKALVMLSPERAPVAVLYGNPVSVPFDELTQDEINDYITQLDWEASNLRAYVSRSNMKHYARFVARQRSWLVLGLEYRRVNVL